MIRHATPEQLAEEIEKRAKGSGALVMITVSDWAMISEAYHSPLVEGIANRALEVSPVREVQSKTLSFDIFEREKR